MDRGRLIAGFDHGIAGNHCFDEINEGRTRLVLVDEAPSGLSRGTRIGERQG
jgi:hypothetical protein